jgi:hypothetical protein
VSITTYAELKTSIADFLDRDDLTSKTGTFISLAEAEISRDLRHWRQEKRINTSVNEQYENLPTDWLRINSVQHAGGGLISSVSASELQSLRAATTTTGKPRYMRLNSNQIELYPVPDQAYVVEVTYLAQTPALTDAAPSNWLLEYAPDLLLYGALKHSAPYLGEDSRLAVWGSLYASGIEALNSETESAVVSGPLSMRIPR